MSIQLELHQSNEVGQPYYTIVRSSENGKVIFWSENYTSRQNAIHAGQLLLKSGLEADFIDKAAA